MPSRFHEGARRSRLPDRKVARRKQSIDTFRRTSLKEAAEVKPLRLKIVSVGPYDTAATLVRRMGVADHRLEGFRVLNGLGPKDPVKPGSKVKIVVGSPVLTEEDGDPEKVDRLSDLGVTKQRTACPIGCVAKNKKQNNLQNSHVCPIFGANNRNLWWAHQGSNLGPAD